METVLLIVLVLLVLGGSGWGYSKYGPAGGLGPIGLFLVVLLALYLTGNFRTI
jgi:hypothetical protein